MVMAVVAAIAGVRDVSMTALNGCFEMRCHKGHRVEFAGICVVCRGRICVGISFNFWVTEVTNDLRVSYCC